MYVGRIVPLRRNELSYVRYVTIEYLTLWYARHAVATNRLMQSVAKGVHEGFITHEALNLLVKLNPGSVA